MQEISPEILKWIKLPSFGRLASKNSLYSVELIAEVFGVFFVSIAFSVIVALVYSIILKSHVFIIF